MKKIGITILCIILFMNVLTIKVNAATEPCKVSISADKTELKAGDTVTINVLVSNVTTTSSIGIFYGILNYSEDLLEIVPEEDESFIADYEEYKEYPILYSGRQDEDSTTENPWYMLLAEENGEKGFIASLDTEFTENEEAIKQGDSQIIAKIKFKVKEDITKTSTAKISLTEIRAVESGDASDDLDEKEISDATMNLTVKVESENSNEEDSNSNSNSYSNSNKKDNNQKNKQEENKAKSNVPYTGIEDVIPVIFILVIITLFAYINYKKYKDI